MIASTLSLRAWACGRSRPRPATRFVTNTVAAMRGLPSAVGPRCAVDGGMYLRTYAVGVLSLVQRGTFHFNVCGFPRYARKTAHMKL